MGFRNVIYMKKGSSSPVPPKYMKPYPPWKGSQEILLNLNGFRDTERERGHKYLLSLKDSIISRFRFLRGVLQELTVLHHTAKLLGANRNYFNK